MSSESENDTVDEGKSPIGYDDEEESPKGCDDEGESPIGCDGEGESSIDCRYSSDDAEDNMFADSNTHPEECENKGTEKRNQESFGKVDETHFEELAKENEATNEVLEQKGICTKRLKEMKHNSERTLKWLSCFTLMNVIFTMAFKGELYCIHPTEYQMEYQAYPVGFPYYFGDLPIPNLVYANTRRNRVHQDIEGVRYRESLEETDMDRNDPVGPLVHANSQGSEETNVENETLNLTTPETVNSDNDQRSNVTEVTESEMVRSEDELALFPQTNVESQEVEQTFHKTPLAIDCQNGQSRQELTRDGYRSEAQPPRLIGHHVLPSLSLLSNSVSVEPESNGHGEMDFIRLDENENVAGIGFVGNRPMENLHQIDEYIPESMASQLSISVCPIPPSAESETVNDSSYVNHTPEHGMRLDDTSIERKTYIERQRPGNMSRTLNRQHTFDRRWPYSYLSAGAMAEAGLYYTGYRSEGQPPRLIGHHVVPSLPLPFHSVSVEPESNCQSEMNFIRLDENENEVGLVGNRPMENLHQVDEYIPESMASQLSSSVCPIPPSAETETVNDSSYMIHTPEHGMRLNDTSIERKTYTERRRPGNISRKLNRQHTFDGRWPHSYLSAGAMAEAGLYYTGCDDRARCFKCGVLIHCWEPGDDPVAEHIKLSESCPYILNLLNNTHSDDHDDDSDDDEVQSVQSGTEEPSVQEDLYEGQNIPYRRNVQNQHSTMRQMLDPSQLSDTIHRILDQNPAALDVLSEGYSRASVANAVESIIRGNRNISKNTIKRELKLRNIRPTRR